MVLAGVVMWTSVPAGITSAAAPEVKAPAGVEVPPSRAGVAPEGVISAEQAVAIARKGFAIGDDFEQAGASFGEYVPSNRGGSWNLFFRKRVDRGFDTIWVTVDARTGEVREMNFGAARPDGDKAGLTPGVGRDEARARAEALVARLQPREFLLTRYEETGAEPVWLPTIRGSVTYRFRFVRLENGIPVQPDGFNVTVDGSGRIQGYSFQWSRDATLPGPDKVLSLAEAQRIFREKVGLRPAYGRVQKPGGPGTLPERKLVYGPTPAGPSPMLIDAVTGQVLDPSGVPVKEAWLAAYPPVSGEPPAAGGVSGAGGAAAGGARAMSREEALSRVAALFTIPADLELEGSYFNENVPPGQSRANKTWSFNWRGKPEGPDVSPPNMHVELDAVTGEVLSLHSFRQGAFTKPDQELPVGIDRDEAARRAGAFIARIRPSLTGRVWVNPLSATGPSGNKVTMGILYQFSPLVMAHGMLDLDMICSVAVDPVGGEAVNFSCPREEGDYPPPGKLLGKQRAEDIYLKEIGLELFYYPIVRQPDGPGPERQEPAAPEFRLAYLPGGGRPPGWIDARSGEVLDAGLQSMTARDADALADVKGHWAEADVKAVVARGVLLPKEGRFNPDVALGRAEALEALLAVARPAFWRVERAANEAADAASGAGGAERLVSYGDVKPDSPHYAVVSEALRYGIITLAGDFRPEAPVTREEMAVMIARALGYKPLVEADSRFYALPFRDGRRVAPWARNAVALAGSLGVFRTEGGRFEPQAVVTRAQMATILVRLSKVVER